MNEKPTTSEALKAVRKKLIEVRSELQEIGRNHNTGAHVKHIDGLLTCGVGELFHTMHKFQQFEIRQDDAERGEHLKFSSRGIGLDLCPGCFVCAGARRNAEAPNKFLNNISAFVSSREDGDKLVDWFGGRARLAYRGYEPNRIQLKVGACDAHLDNLRALNKAAIKQDVIRKKDIEEAVRMTSRRPNTNEQS